MTNPRHVLISGATGFVGQALCTAVTARAWNVRRAVRSGAIAGDFVIPNVGPESDWSRAVEGIECVVHLAARTNVL